MSLRIQNLALGFVLAAAVACGGGDGKKDGAGGVAPAGGGKPAAGAPAGGGAAPAAGGKYDKAKGTATLKGVVRFKGTPPAKEMYVMGTEPKCAAHGASQMERKEVNDDGSLPWVFVRAVEGASLGLSGYEAPVVEVDQKGCTYMPHVFGALAGQEVTFMNGDNFSHNVHVKGKVNDWNRSQNAGQKDNYKTQKEFGVKVICDVHSWMNSWMHVVDHPFFATSARGSGAFEIKGLYPGKHKFRAWHETWAKDKQVEFEIELKDGENTHTFEISGS